ncbi:hypothetical protein PVIIG_06042 [Plasmodium vivax India VII]|uniref:Variable surface protein Vir18 n=1 Tax=Plasmodium vivax India VII TaxID=1077284 RepID=A0A0J9S1W5_PLAVI|nr:hypothetical protein PVIIG_06042 [Plasmodium vivax India VII]
MDFFSRRFTGPINFYSMYNGARCMNDYTSYKIDIEREIDNFEKNTSGNYYKAWEKLNKYITDKNNSLNECYRNRYVTVTLIEDDKIKKFMNRCSKNRQCNNRPRQTQRTTSTNPETKGSCKGPNDCKKQSAPKEAKPNPNPTSPEVVSKTRSSSRQNSDDQGKSHAAEPGSSQGSVKLQTQTSIDHSVPSVLADTKASEQRDNTHSGVSGQTETQAQSTLVSSLKKENLFDPHRSNASSQGISNGRSPSIGNFPLKVLEANKHLDYAHGSKDFSGTALGEHATPVESFEVKTTRDNNFFKTSCAENPTEGTPARGENGDGHSPQTVANSVGTERTAVLSGDSVTINVETVNSGQVHLILVLSGNRDADSLTPRRENSRGVDDESKVAGVISTEEGNTDSNDAVANPPSEVSSDEITCIEEIINNTSSWELCIDKKISNIANDSLHSSYECDLTFTVKYSSIRATSIARNNDYKYLCCCKKFYKIYRMYHLMIYRLLKNNKPVQK